MSNEPAFPNSLRRNTSSDPLAKPSVFDYPGMTLRDYFAGQALAGFAASEAAIAKWNDGTVARCCYEVADALLIERERGQ